MERLNMAVGSNVIPMLKHKLLFTERYNMRLFNRLVDELGLNKDAENRLQRVIFYTLRHTFASWLAIEGENIVTIRNLMGHKKIETTMRYIHLMPNQGQDAVNRLDKCFDQETI